MSGIKYYQLAKGEELPDEFCVVRDVDGEPSEYMFYVPETENTKLRELVLQLWECPVDDNKCTDCPHCKEHYDVCAGENHCKLYDRMRELGVEVEP